MVPYDLLFSRNMTELIRENMELHWTGNQSYSNENGVELYTFNSEKVQKMIRKSSDKLEISYDDEECHESTSESDGFFMYSYKNKQQGYENEVHSHDYRDEQWFWVEQIQGTIGGECYYFSQFGCGDNYSYSFYFGGYYEEYEGFEQDDSYSYTLEYGDELELGTITEEKTPANHHYLHEFHNIQGFGTEGTVDPTIIPPAPQNEILHKIIRALLFISLVIGAHIVLLL